MWRAIKRFCSFYIKLNETHDRTRSEGKYFASKFKSTLHNLVANSITFQMELERTTHAKVLETMDVSQIIICSEIEMSILYFIF